MLPKRIILVRHGRPAANDDQTLYSRVPDYKIELVDQGRKQAQHIANVVRIAPPEVMVVKIADRLCNTLEFLANGEVEHACTCLGYGEPLRNRIGDCKYAMAIMESWNAVDNSVRKKQNEGG